MGAPSLRSVGGVSDCAVEQLTVDSESRQNPSEDDLRSFARFAEAFGEPEFTPGTSHPAEEIEPDVYSFGWFEYAPAVSEWHQELYDRNVIDPDSDYLSEAFAHRMRRFSADPTLLSAADLPTIRTVLTNIARGERFCDGYMSSAFESGSRRRRHAVSLTLLPVNESRPC